MDQVLRWRVISCLAEGADRIVAQQARKRERSSKRLCLMRRVNTVRTLSHRRQLRNSMTSSLMRTG